MVLVSNHRFTEKTDNTWNVICKETRGSFNTILWENGKVNKGVCPCCNREVKK